MRRGGTALAAQHVKRAQHRPRIKERRIESVLFHCQPAALLDESGVERNSGIGRRWNASRGLLGLKRAFFHDRDLTAAVPFARAPIRLDRRRFIRRLGRVLATRVAMTMVVRVRPMRRDVFTRCAPRTASASRRRPLAHRAAAQGRAQCRGGEQIGGYEKSGHGRWGDKAPTPG